MRQRYRQYNLATENRNPFVGVITLKKQNLTANERKHISLDKAENSVIQKQKRENVFYRDIKLKTAQFCCKQTPTYCRCKKRLNKRDLATESENLLCSTI